jgi:hypothetical protein
VNIEKDALGWAAMAASIAVTAQGEWSLAVDCGYAPLVAAGLPVAIDAYAIRAMRAGREIFPPVLLMVATNAAAHLLHGGMLSVTPWLVVLVSAIAPVVLWRVHALLRHEGADPEPEPVEYEAPPVAETQPEPVRPVPVAVPEGARLLPTFECRGELQRALRNERPALVPAAEHARTRPEVHAEYVPEPSGDDDPLTEAGLNDAAESFRAELLGGDLPPIREIKSRLRVGQTRAKEIQEAFRQALPQLAGAGVTS